MADHENLDYSRSTDAAGRNRDYILHCSICGLLFDDEDNWMNKSLVKALHELHERGITENEWERLEWFRPNSGKWKGLWCSQDADLRYDCEYRIKPRTITVELTEDELDRFLYNLPPFLHGKAGDALVKLQKAAGKEI